MKKNIAKALAGLCVVAVLAEASVRLCGAVDFPTYLVDDWIGYIPKPNQHGAFLRRHAWVFNDRSMGTENSWNPSARPNILLIGNSIAMGGNPYDQKDKLGPLIQNEVGNRYAVWPIAAGGWTNVNETAYLDRNPDVAQATYYFMWEYMSGGLSGLSEWRGEYVFPKSTPVWASGYVLRRYVLPLLVSLNMNELPPTGTLNTTHLANFRAAVAALSKAAKSKEHGLIFFYPKKAEYLSALQGRDWLPERLELERVGYECGSRIVDISRTNEWYETLYKGDGIHLTVQGNVVLAKVLAAAMKEAMAQ